MSTSTKFTVYIEQDEDGVFIGTIPMIPSCYAEGDTQEEMLANLSEVAKLCLRNMDPSTLANVHFVGIENIDVSDA